jgi:phosphoenolpyruvate-protein kinase (PTS system EI component)
MLMMVDGDRGLIQLRPMEDEVEDFLERKRSLERRREALRAEAAEPAVTPDGGSMLITVNIESLRDFDTFELDQVDACAAFLGRLADWAEQD